MNLPHINSVTPRALLVAAVACLAIPHADAAQDRKAEKERAEQWVHSVYQSRARLALADLARHVDLSDELLKGAEEASIVAIDAFLAQHPVRLVDVGPISWTATPIEHEPFTAFAASDAWAKGLEAALPSPAVLRLKERRDARAKELRDALSSLLGQEIARGLCLTAAEIDGLEAPLIRAAVLHLRGKSSGGGDPFETPGGERIDSLIRLMEKADLASALAGERLDVFREFVQKGRRSALHDYRLEVEFFTRGRDDRERSSRLLNGAATAITHRGGKAAKSTRASLRPLLGSVQSRREWSQVLRGVLGLSDDDPLPTLPLRQEDALLEARSRYLLAALDARASFSADQIESLAPLITETLRELRVLTRGDALILLPREFGISPDGRLVPSANGGIDASTKVRARIKTFFEACTQDQLDGLGL